MNTTSMSGLWGLLVTVYVVLVALALPFTRAQLHPKEPSRYHVFPSLREQAQIQDEWREERLGRLPELMRRHGVDVWLVGFCSYGVRRS